MLKTNLFRKASLIFAVGLLAGPAMSQTPNPPTSSPSKEQRETMAKMHEKMAACLRSNKSMDECHHEMRMACEQSGMSCGKGMMHGHEHSKKGMDKQ